MAPKRTDRDEIRDDPDSDFPAGIPGNIGEIRTAPDDAQAWSASNLESSISGTYETTLTTTGTLEQGTLVTTLSPANAMTLNEATLHPILPGGAPDLLLRKEELRLDVDRENPLMMASGVIHLGRSASVDWIANLRPAGTACFIGNIWFKEGNSELFPQSEVEIKVTRNPVLASRRVTVVFSGGGGNTVAREYRLRTPYFQKLRIALDRDLRTEPVLAIQPHDHPNRPGTVPRQPLTVIDVLNKAGYDVEITPVEDIHPISTGVEDQWTHAELHDAMVTYNQEATSVPPDTIWTLVVARHAEGDNLAGIAFDNLGTKQRQGVAVFQDAHILRHPNGDPSPGAWEDRMMFFNLLHQWGHALGLGHSWNKAGGPDWIPQNDESQARSFMNYPSRVIGGQGTFFREFEFRFSGTELLYLRHAPQQARIRVRRDRYGARGLEALVRAPEPKLELELRANRGTPIWSFIEPVILEIKLKNISEAPLLVDENLLRNLQDMTVTITRDGQPPRRVQPFYRDCLDPRPMVLEPGCSCYETLPVFAGLDGWYTADPGYYRIQAILHLENEDIVSEPLVLRVTPPRTYDEAFVAQDLHTDEIARTLIFGGSQVMLKALDVLREAADRFPNHPIAVHVNLALGRPAMIPYKTLEVEQYTRGSVPSIGKVSRMKVRHPNMEEVRRHLNLALTRDVNLAAETLGHIGLKAATDRYTDFLAGHELFDDAVRIQEQLAHTLNARNALESVLQEVQARAKDYERLRSAPPEERRTRLTAKGVARTKPRLPEAKR